MSVVCSKCGFENSERARFCGGCAVPLEEVAAPRETRKTVTVVFCDVTDSTSLGERLEWQAPLGLYEAKGAVVEAAKVREELAGVHAS